MECCEGGSALEAMTGRPSPLAPPRLHALTPIGFSTVDLGQPFNEKQTRHIILHALHGLIYLNSNYIMHRDIKAANILITDTGDAKLGNCCVLALCTREVDRVRARKLQLTLAFRRVWRLDARGGTRLSAAPTGWHQR
jgi:serine/threonine protein kinase